MISRMIASLTCSHAIFTEDRFFEPVGGHRALKFSTLCSYLSAQLGIELLIEDQIELATLMFAIQSAHQCPDHRIFEFAHVLYHLCDEDQPTHTVQ